MKKYLWLLIGLLFLLGVGLHREFQKSKWFKQDIEYRECLKVYGYDDTNICLLLRDASPKQIKELESIGLLPNLSQ